MILRFFLFIFVIHSINASAINENEIPSLIKAVLDLDTARVSELLSAQKNPNVEYRGTPAILFSIDRQRGCSLSILKLLINAGADVNLIDPLTKTSALHLAATVGNSKCFDLLLNNGADPLVADNTQSTIAHRACESGNLHILNAAISEGVPIDDAAVQGVTPLMIASFSGHRSQVERLLTMGSVDACKRDVRGRTSKDMAKLQGHEAIAKLLPDCARQQKWKSE